MQPYVYCAVLRPTDTTQTLKQGRIYYYESSRGRQTKIIVKRQTSRRSRRVGTERLKRVSTTNGIQLFHSTPHKEPPAEVTFNFQEKLAFSKLVQFPNFKRKTLCYLCPTTRWRGGGGIDEGVIVARGIRLCLYTDRSALARI